jgi:excisionase family DNA binding protein
MALWLGHAQSHGGTVSGEEEIRAVAEMLVDAIRRAVEAEVRCGSPEAASSYGSGLAPRGTIRAARLGRLGSHKNLLAWLREQTSYMSVAQVGRQLKKHPETIYRLISEEGLPAVKDHHRWKIDPNSLADWLEARGFAVAVATTPVGKRGNGNGARSGRVGSRPARPG